MKVLFTVFLCLGFLMVRPAQADPPSKRLQQLQKHREEEKRKAEEKKKEEERIRQEVEKRVAEETAKKRAEEEAKKKAEETAHLTPDPATYTRPVGDPLTPPQGTSESLPATGTADARFEICWDKGHNWFAYIDLNQAKEQTTRVGGLFDVKLLKMPKAGVYFRSNRSDDNWRGYSVESPATVINGPLVSYVLDQPGQGAGAKFQATTQDHAVGFAKFTPVGDTKEVEMACKLMKTALSVVQMRPENLRKLELSKSTTASSDSGITATVSIRQK